METNKKEIIALHRRYATHGHLTLNEWTKILVDRLKKSTEDNKKTTVSQY